MKNNHNISPIQLLLSVLLCFPFSTVQAQFSPENEIDTSGLDMEIVADGLDTVFYFGEMETTDSTALRLTYSGYHDANIN